MSESPNKLIRFWQELKRRKTGKVIVAYAATAFILLQLADILTPALLLPEWTTRLITLILIIGFPIAVIFSWVFDITPEGIKKTEPIRVSENKETIKKPVKKILSASNIIIVALIIAVGILAYPKIFKPNTLEKLRSSGERISVAVMPFQNMTNDTTWNVWQDGIQNELITSLTNSEELKVRQTESINNLIQSKGLTNYASITPSIASNISQKLDANVFVYGSIKQVGKTIRVNAQLIDSKTKDVFKSFQIEGTSDKIMSLIDTLSWKLKDYLVISKLKKETLPQLQSSISTNSPEAYRYFLYGWNAFIKQDYPTARDWFFKSFGIDSNFVEMMFEISLSYGNQGLMEEARKWCLKAYEKRNLMSMKMKIRTNWLYASYFETPYEAIKYLKQLQEIDNQDGFFDLGNNYSWLHQYDKAIPEYEKAIEINKKQGLKGWPPNYTGLGFVYHRTQQYKKEKKLYKIAEQDFPDDPVLIYRQAILSLTEGDNKDATKYIEKYRFIRKENSWSEADITTSLAEIYSEAGMLEKAEQYYRQTLSSVELTSDTSRYFNNLAWFLIDKDRNIEGGMTLIDKVLKLSPDNYTYVHTKEWALYKQGKYKEALKILQKSWDLRMKCSCYDYSTYLHLEAAKKAVAIQKNN
jgi:TolB-like protein/Tfp pilus assembly protein PilF